MKKLYALLFVSILGIYISSAQTQLWGVTTAGGAGAAGTIFHLNLDGSNPAVAYSFNSDSLTGYSPGGSLIQANNGLLYGLTPSGGAVDSISVGVIFSYDPVANIYTDVFDFDYDNSGASPQNSFSPYSDNNKFYGTTSDGGLYGGGTIFSFDPDSNIFAKLYDFTDSGGRNPYGNLVEGPDGKFYGLTSQGGIDSVGTLFSFDITNNKFSNLHNFTHTTGDAPDGSLILINDTVFYGMTSSGGSNGFGSIFSFNLGDSVYLDLHDFNDTLGEYPYGSLMKASDGDLYGMTSGGGQYGQGVIFNFSYFNNAYNDLNDFTGTGGSSPNADLVQSAINNKLYGTTQFGGALDSGVVFSFDPSNNNYVDLLDFNGTNGNYPTGDLIIPNVPTGIHEVSDNADVQLYPNPANKQLMISIKASATASGIEKMDIYNLVGEKIYSEAFSSSGLMTKATVDVSDLSSGVYFVHLQQAQGTWVGKFVKE